MNVSYVDYIGVDVRYKDDSNLSFSHSPPPKYDYKCFQEPEYISDREEWFLEQINSRKRYINKNEIVSISWKSECVDDIKDSEIWKNGRVKS